MGVALVLSVALVCGTVLWIVERYLGPWWTLAREVRAEQLEGRKRVTRATVVVPPDLQVRHVNRYDDEWAREEARRAILEDYEAMDQDWDKVRQAWNARDDR